MDHNNYFLLKVKSNDEISKIRSKNRDMIKKTDTWNDLNYSLIDGYQTYFLISKDKNVYGMVTVGLNKIYNIYYNKYVCDSILNICYNSPRYLDILLFKVNEMYNRQFKNYLLLLNSYDNLKRKFLGIGFEFLLNNGRYNLYANTKSVELFNKINNISLSENKEDKRFIIVCHGSIKDIRNKVDVNFDFKYLSFFVPDFTKLMIQTLKPCDILEKICSNSYFEYVLQPVNNKINTYQYNLGVNPPWIEKMIPRSMIGLYYCDNNNMIKLLDYYDLYSNMYQNQIQNESSEKSDKSEKSIISSSSSKMDEEIHEEVHISHIPFSSSESLQELFANTTNKYIKHNNLNIKNVGMSYFICRGYQNSKNISIPLEKGIYKEMVPILEPPLTEEMDISSF